jgi:hypothetical protein
VARAHHEPERIQPNWCEYHPTGMIARRGLKGLAAVLLAAGALAGCGGSSSPPAVSSVHLTQAAYRTTHGAGFKMALDMNVSLGDQSVAISGSGALDSHSRGMFTLRVADQTIDEIIALPEIYVKAPNGTAKTPWVKARVNVFTQGGGATSSASDPSKLLDYLKSSGDVQRVGTATVRGTPTVQYKASVDLARYVSKAAPSERKAAQRQADLIKKATGSDTLPVDAFVDAQGRVRREALKFSLCTAQGKADLAMTIDLYDFGPQTIAAPPPSDQVTDITDQLQSQVDQSLGQLSSC